MKLLKSRLSKLPVSEKERAEIDILVRRRLEGFILQFHFVNILMLGLSIMLFGYSGLPLDDGYFILLLGLIPGFGLAFYMALPERSDPVFQCSGLVFGVCTALAYRFLGEDFSNLDFWLMPMSMLLTFTAAMVFASPAHHFVYTLICWVIMSKGGGISSGVSGQEPLVIFLVVSGIGLASVTCLLVDHSRRRSMLLEIRLQKLANYDALTGLRNRRSFLEIAESSLKVRKALSPCYFALVDVDNFKRFNDELGHRAGDEVLKQVAETIANHSSPHPSGRLGGEEFGILLMDLNPTEVRAFADSLVAAIASSGRGPLTATASIGLAFFHQGVALPDVMHQADLALYEAKRSGKNRWVGSNIPAEAHSPSGRTSSVFLTWPQSHSEAAEA